MLRDAQQLGSVCGPQGQGQPRGHMGCLGASIPKGFLRRMLGRGAAAFPCSVELEG